MNLPPYNTDAPYTAEDIARFNRFTHFPKDRDKENRAFAGLITHEERTRAEETLKPYGKTVIPDDVARALERLRRARYQVFVTAVRSREIAPPWSVVGPARYAEHANPDRAHRMMGLAYEEFNNARAALAHRLRRHGPSQVIRSDQAAAVDILEARITAAKRQQERMKRANPTRSSARRARTSRGRSDVWIPNAVWIPSGRRSSWGRPTTSAQNMR